MRNSSKVPEAYVLSSVKLTHHQEVWFEHISVSMQSKTKLAPLQNAVHAVAEQVSTYLTEFGKQVDIDFSSYSDYSEYSTDSEEEDENVEEEEEEDEEEEEEEERSNRKKKNRRHNR